MANIRGKRTYTAPAASAMLDIIELLAKSETPYGVADISRQTGNSTNMVFRVTRVMHERGYLRQIAHHKYRLTGKMLALSGYADSMGMLYATAYVRLKELAVQVRETISFYVPFGGQAMLLLDVPSPERFKTRITPGSEYPAHATAAGKVLLACEAIPVPKGRLSKHTANTITSVASLQRELRTIRRVGYAINREETTSGLRGVAAPIVGVDGVVVAAVSLVAPLQRLDNERLKKVLPQVKNVAKAISSDLNAPEDKLEKALRMRAKLTSRF